MLGVQLGCISVLSLDDVPLRDALLVVEVAVRCSSSLGHALTNSCTALELLRTRGFGGEVEDTEKFSMTPTKGGIAGGGCKQFVCLE